MTDLILHAYDASPFTQKALRMLGLKGLDWRWVETPMMPPKDELVELTGGYRGTPVLQIGNHVYVDSQLIAAELERRFPEPTFFPAGDRGVAFMLAKWSETFFRAGLGIAVHETAKGWPQPFLDDRRFLFPDFDFDGAMADASHARSQFRVHAGWLDAQLADGRAFLQGEAPGLADIQAWVFVWMARAYYPDVAAVLLAAFTRLPGWEARVAALGEGRRRPIPASDALTVARAAPGAAATGGAAAPAIDPADPLSALVGRRVEVSPEDTRRGAVVGELQALGWDQIVVRRRGPRCGEVHVHFPRIGYRLREPLAPPGGQSTGR